MVSTRHHPRPFPPPPEPTSPSPRTPASTTSSSKPTQASASPPPSTARSRSRKRKSTSDKPKEEYSQDEDDSLTKTALKKISASARSRSKSNRNTIKSPRALYTHTPSSFLILWLLISLPLVIWDTIYILLRPHTMPGGRLHYPFWTPYELYGRIDYIYGALAWESQNGFTAAQGTLNAFETAVYIYYLFILSRSLKTFAPNHNNTFRNLIRFPFLTTDKSTATSTPIAVHGDTTLATAVLLVFANLVVTSSKTVLYALNEHYSGYKHIRHNFESPLRLIGLWILPNGPWIVVPAVFAVLLGREIVEAMTADRGGRGRAGVGAGVRVANEESVNGHVR